MRSVDLSNTVLIVSPPPDEAEDAFSENAVVIRDQVNEILELTPAVPKLHKLGLLLKGREYDEGQEEADAENETVCIPPTAERSVFASVLAQC